MFIHSCRYLIPKSNRLVNYHEIYEFLSGIYYFVLILLYVIVLRVKYRIHDVHVEGRGHTHCRLVSLRRCGTSVGHCTYAHSVTAQGAFLRTAIYTSMPLTTFSIYTSMHLRTNMCFWKNICIEIFKIR